ncbi:MAG TPA: YraN family protein [Kiritimatiellia bacterium]|jgi:putative endonuclease
MKRLVALLHYFRPPRPAHLLAGEWGEKLAERHLRKKGFKILGRRVRIGDRDELDLVARHGNVLVFVEVKTRATEDFGRPSEAIGREKERNLERAALAYIRRLREKPPYFRFDVVEVVGTRGSGRPEIRHLEDAVEMRSRGNPAW